MQAERGIAYGHYDVETLPHIVRLRSFALRLSQAERISSFCVTSVPRAPLCSGPSPITRALANPAGDMVCYSRLRENEERWGL